MAEKILNDERLVAQSRQPAPGFTFFGNRHFPERLDQLEYIRSLKDWMLAEPLAEEGQTVEDLKADGMVGVYRRQD